MASSRWGIGLVALGTATLSGCVVGESVDGRVEALDQPGAWAIPADTLAIGDTQYVAYDGAGLWNDGLDCSGGLTPGAGILRTYLREHFPQTSTIGGYACRQNTGNTAYMSIHAVGRALDIMLPTSNGAADNDLGDPIGNWLIENAETIGIQYIIWDQWTWMAARTPGAKGRLYTGPNPHIDHLHVEIDEQAGAQTTDWFSALVTPPGVAGCGALGAFGGVIDDADPCFQFFGPSQYWRLETTIGYGGSLRWTNAFTSTAPSNWARVNLDLAEAGDYEVEVFLTAPFAIYAATEYVVRHAGVEDTVYVDQAMEAKPEGVWVSLGVYAFAAGADQNLSVFDDVAGGVASGQHIVADAVRLTRVGMTPPDPGPIDEAPGGDPDVDPSTEPLAHRGGCVVAGADAGVDAVLPLLAGLGVLLVRARARRRVG